MSVLSNVNKSGVTALPTQAQEDRTAPARFWRLFKDNAWAMVKINLLTLLFMLPAVAWYMVMEFAIAADGMLVPYSANIGIGIKVVTDAVSVGAYRAYVLQLRRWLVMIPCIIVAFIGFSGAFYTMKALIRGEAEPKVKTFFRGIKKGWLPFLVMSVPIALAVFATAVSVSAFPVRKDVPTAIGVLAIVASALALFVVIVFSMFLTTSSISYKLKTGVLIGNSLRFTLGLLHRSFIVVALCALPVVLAIVTSQFLAMLFIVFFLLIGLSFIILALSVYTQWAYDKYIDSPLKAAEKKTGKGKKKGGK